MKASKRPAPQPPPEKPGPGLRLVQVVTLDPADPGLRERLRQQSIAIAEAEHEREIMDWVERVTDYTGWEP